MKRERWRVVFVVASIGVVARGAWSAPAKKGPLPAASASASASSSASGVKSLTESLTGEAKQDFEDGAFAYKNGDYAGALVKLQRAFELSKDPRILWNMALCEQKLRHYAEATRLFQRYLTEGEALVTDEDREKAKTTIAQIEPFTSTLIFTVDQGDAEVFVDDVSIGKTPLAAGLLVDIGTRKVVVKKQGFVDFKQDVLVDGSKREVPIAVTMAVEKHEGKITIRAPAGAEIFIDGNKVAVGEWTGVLESKGHTLRVTKPGMRVYQTEIVVQDKDVRTIDVPLEPEVETEVAEVYDRWEADLRLGYGKILSGDKPKYDEIGASFGVRMGRPTWIGLHLSYGRMDASAGACGRNVPGPGPSSAFDLSRHESMQACNVVHAALAFMVHFLPRSKIDPWLGFDVGVLNMWGPVLAYQPTAGSSTAKTVGYALLAGAQVGVDVHPLDAFPRWAIGPFFAIDLSIASTYKPSIPPVNNANLSSSVSDPYKSGDNGDVRNFGNWVVGLRNAISF
jgi:hypothetical protein